MTKGSHCRCDWCVCRWWTGQLVVMSTHFFSSHDTRHCEKKINNNMTTLIIVGELKSLHTPPNCAAERTTQIYLVRDLFRGKLWSNQLTSNLPTSSSPLTCLVIFWLNNSYHINNQVPICLIIEILIVKSIFSFTLYYSL